MNKTCEIVVYLGDDRGDSWQHRSGNLNDRYGPGIAVSLEDPDTILCGVSDVVTFEGLRTLRA